MSDQVVGWKAKAKIKEDNISTYEEILSPLEPAIDIGFENGNWFLTAFFTDGQSENSILNAFKIADDITSTSLSVNFSPIHDKDWQKKMKYEFDPLEMSGFFVHSNNEDIPDGFTGLKIPAGMAFGTGEHPTTEACLTLYDELTTSISKPLTKILDMGCGSAILAIAAAKRDGVPAVAVDIHEPSVEISIENCDVNNVSDIVTCAYSDGFNSEIVKDSSPYSLVFANILANSLIEMSSDIYSNLEQGGFAILSGYLEEQKPSVIAAFEAQGFVHINDVCINGWVASTVARPE